MRIKVKHNINVSSSIKPLRFVVTDIPIDTPNCDNIVFAAGVQAGEKLADWFIGLPSAIRDGFAQRIRNKYGMRFG